MRTLYSTHQTYPILRMSKSTMLLAVTLALSACAQPPARETDRICDAGGCADRPRGHASFSPSADVDREAGRRLAALEALARKDPRASYDLGLRYYRGDGVAQDSYEALRWMRDAAERGDLPAQKAVGRFYLTGLEEMGADPQEAEKWLAMAAGRGDEEAARLLQEARQAKQSEATYRRWSDHWRRIVQRDWVTTYPYRAHWRHGDWTFR